MLEPLHSVQQANYVESTSLPPLGDRVLAGMQVGITYLSFLGRVLIFLSLLAIAAVPVLCLSLFVASDDSETL